MEVMVKPDRGRPKESIAQPLEVASVRERVLDVAERLFAMHGVAETSIRTLTAEAGVNVAAVNYYFGSREELFQQVVARRRGPLNAARAQALAKFAAESDGNPLEVEQILEAVLEPSLRIGFQYPYFARLASRLRLDSDSARWEVYREHQLSQLMPFQDALAAALPHLTEDELIDRFHLVLGAIHIMWGHCPLPPEKSVGEMIKSMIVFYAAGMRAPMP